MKYIISVVYHNLYIVVANGWFEICEIPEYGANRTCPYGGRFTGFIICDITLATVSIQMNFVSNFFRNISVNALIDVRNSFLATFRYVGVIP